MGNNPRALLLALLTAVSAIAADPQVAGAKPTIEERITAAAIEARLPLSFEGTKFSGPGWTRLIEERRAAQFFLIGEEHGIAENPQLAAALFAALQPAEYSRMAIEVSPPIAVFNPSAWSYQPAPAKDGYARHLGPILAAADPERFTLIDLRPLRSLLARSAAVHPELRRTVFGFDALLVFSGSTASSNVPRPGTKAATPAPR
ncbi:MAG: hypothetical protein ABR517_03970 [Thermoanaerobaculia bacterium]